MLALLRAVEFGWQQKTAAENADQIRLLGEELYKGVLELRDHFNHVGSSLRQAIKHFNKAIGSLEIGILDPTRQLKDLGAAGTSKNISAIASIGATARTLHTPELPNPTGGET
jgi:DNA recombination protein RmuC